MPRALSNGMELEYDTFGDPSRPTVLLIMGLGTQMTAWRPEFCRAVAERGFHVVRYDNRDCGLSTFLDDCPTPDIRAVLAGDTSTVPYLIADMARDAVGLLDALGVEAAHVVGASMGGMIAQQFAIDHPDRVLSLCSIMSTTGARSVGKATSEALAALTAPPPGSREEAVELPRRPRTPRRHVERAGGPARRLGEFRALDHVVRDAGARFVPGWARLRVRSSRRPLHQRARNGLHSCPTPSP